MGSQTGATNKSSAWITFLNAYNYYPIVVIYLFMYATTSHRVVKMNVDFKMKLFCLRSENLLKLNPIQ